MIIGAVYRDISCINMADAEGSSSYGTVNTRAAYQSGNNDQTDTLVNKFYYPKYVDNSLRDYSASVGQHFVTIPNLDEREYWVRIFFRSTTTTHTGGDYDFFAFHQDSVALPWNVVGSFRLNSANQYVWLVRDGGATINTQVICNKSLIPVNSNDQEYILDVRIFLDPVAGFVQLYDYTGTKVGEFLGKTINDQRYPTHAQLLLRNLSTTAAYMNNTFIIFANEPTFGMYMVPLRAKAEGGRQDQDAGFTYANISTRRPYFSGWPTSVDMTVNLGETKRYTFTPKDMSDVALPANYVVRSVHLHSIMDGTTANGDTLAPKHLLRFKSDTSEYEYPVQNEILTNTRYAAANKYQTNYTILNTNPKTNQSWTVADMTDLEVGVSLTR